MEALATERTDLAVVRMDVDEEAAKQLANELGIRSIPYLYLVNAEGQLIAEGHGEVLEQIPAPQ